MKNFLLIMILALASCGPMPQGNKLSPKYLFTIEHDGCEYVLGSDYSDGSGIKALVHKGNCKFCAERSGYTATTDVTSPSMDYKAQISRLEAELENLKNKY